MQSKNQSASSARTSDVITVRTHVGNDSEKAPPMVVPNFDSFVRDVEKAWEQSSNISPPTNVKSVISERHITPPRTGVIRTISVVSSPPRECKRMKRELVLPISASSSRSTDVAGRKSSPLSVEDDKLLLPISTPPPSIHKPLSFKSTSLASLHPAPLNSSPKTKKVLSRGAKEDHMRRNFWKVVLGSDFDSSCHQLSSGLVGPDHIPPQPDSSMPHLYPSSSATATGPSPLAPSLMQDLHSLPSRKRHFDQDQLSGSNSVSQQPHHDHSYHCVQQKHYHPYCSDDHRSSTPCHEQRHHRLKHHQKYLSIYRGNQKCSEEENDQQPGVEKEEGQRQHCASRENLDSHHDKNEKQDTTNQPSLFVQAPEGHHHRREIVEDDEKPFACRSCPLRFRKRCNLMTHISNVHDKIRPFYCSLCLRRFARKSNCAKHMRLVHHLSHDRIKVLKVQQE